MPPQAAAIEELLRFGAEAARAGLLTGTSGNASLRLDGSRFAVTGTGTALEALRPADIAICALSDGRRLEGARPSIETELHRRCYLARPAVGAVLHAQSPAATTLACAADPPPNLDLIPEVPAYVGRHVTVGWAMPGSAALAEGVARALADAPDASLVQLANHGQVVTGATWGDVLRRARFFELACRITLAGVPLRRIPEADAARLRAGGYGDR